VGRKSRDTVLAAVERGATPKTSDRLAGSAPSTAGPAVRGDRWDADLLAGPGHGPPAAFVLGGASAQALGFVRSLGRRGILTVALGVRPGPWVWSRYCAFRAAADSEPELLDRLTRLGRRMTRRAVIVATGDSEVLFLSRNRDSLGAAYDFVLPRPSVVELLSDKRSQYRYAAGIGIPIPRTYYPDGPADVPGIARAVRFPCVVKPAHSHAGDTSGRESDSGAGRRRCRSRTPGSCAPCANACTSAE
jgi:hypothetical protein